MIMERSYITPRSFKNKKISNGRFSDILISLSAILPEENFHKIITEIDNLEIEINASHFTAAAMRVGRTIEYSLYVCAKSWDVSINNITTRKLELFDKNYEMFKSAFIENT